MELEVNDNIQSSAPGLIFQGERIKGRLRITWNRPRGKESTKVRINKKI